MSITVSFTTESKKRNSTRQLNMSQSIQCNFKNGCSMLRPTLLLELQSDTFPNYTGFKIEDRYYTVTDIRSVRNHLFEVDGEVDVLATYKTLIGNSTQYVIRSSARSNQYIIDKKYPALADTDLYEKPLPNLAADEEGTFILGVMGIGETQGCVKYYAVPAFLMLGLYLALFSNQNLDDDPAAMISMDIQKQLFNPIQYIVSCQWMPIPFEYFNFNFNVETVYFGWWEAHYTIEGEDYTFTAARIKEVKRIYKYEQILDPPKHPQAETRGRFLNDSPYTRYTLHCYTFGSIPIDPSPFVDGDVASIEINVDIYTGVAQLYINLTRGTLLSLSSQFGVPIQLSQVNSNFIGSALSMVQAGIDIAATGNVAGAVKGIASAVTEAFPQVHSNGNVASKAAFVQAPTIVGEFRQIVPEYNANLGRPFCQQNLISQLPGYIECENVAIDLAATEEEKRQVISFMEQGFFYE